MKAIVFEIKPLFYSYKSPVSYQIKTSNILPPPSALLGAIYKSYVEVANLDFSQDTLIGFLRAVKFVGTTVVPKTSSRTHVIKKFSVLMKHHRLEYDPKVKEGKREDAMVREFIFIEDGILGLIAFEDAMNHEILMRAVEGIEYLGNSESLVSVNVLDVVDVKEKGNNGVMMQMVSSSVTSLPSIGIIEQCGKIPKRPWGSRESKDVCYVWNPLISLGRDRYRVVYLDEIANMIKQRKSLFVHSDKLGEGLVFSPDDFECLYK